MEVYKNFINGKWLKSETGQRYNNYNPANHKQILGSFQLSDKNDVDLAVESAQNSFENWKSVPAPKRGEILLRFAKLLRLEKKRLGKLVTLEMGKVVSEGLGDVQEAIDIAEYMAGEGRRMFGHTTPSELRDKFCMTIRQPIGVCGLIAPWNFPTAIPAWKLMPALICGNSVVIKPASDTPLCAIELVKLLDKAGIPRGVVNLVTGTGEDVGTPIVKHKGIRAISFTGSRDVGKFVIKNAGLKKVGLELGGKNAIIVMDDADIPNAVEGILFGAFGTTGQRCTATSRVIVHEKVKEKLERMLLLRVKKMKVGNGLNADIGPLINQNALEKTCKYVDIGKNEGAKFIFKGKVNSSKGWFHSPVIFTGVSVDMRIAKEEIFGPILSIMPVKNFNEAIDVSNSIDYGLSSAIYTANLRNAFVAISKLDAGITYVNSSTIGAEVHLPFGGVKDTGNGTREAGILGIEEFSDTKTVYIDYSGKLQKAQIDDVKIDVGRK